MKHRLDVIEGCMGKGNNEFLMMSRLHCHTRNVSSIVLSSGNGCLLRAFLAWPGHELSQNVLGKAMPVGIHNHRYSLLLRGLAGHVRNTCYTELEPDQQGGVMLNKWAFESRLTNPDARIEQLARRAVVQASSDVLTWSSVSALPHWQLHNIDCSGPAAWLVSESNPVASKTTTLFTVADSIDMTGLYETFESADAVREHVNEFTKLF